MMRIILPNTVDNFERGIQPRSWRMLLVVMAVAVAVAVAIGVAYVATFAVPTRGSGPRRPSERVESGQHVIDQGHDGDNFYVIDSGTCDIYVDIDGKKCIGAYDGVGSFGELALMYNMPRAATIIATSNVALRTMDPSTFRRIVLRNVYNKRKMYEALLENVLMLKAMNSYESLNVADSLQSKAYEDNDLIIKQNDPSQEVDVNRQTKGQYFGESAILTHKPRPASAYAQGKTKCAVLDEQAFQRLLGKRVDIMRRVIEEYERELERLFGSNTNIMRRVIVEYERELERLLVSKTNIMRRVIDAFERELESLFVSMRN